MSPTARTLKLLREWGYYADVVERWNPGSGTRHDLFGFGDVFAFKVVGKWETEKPKWVTWTKILDPAIVQATTVGNMGSRVSKILANEIAKDWVNGGGTLWVIGWKKYSRPVDGKLWRYKLRRMRSEDFPAS